MAEHGFAGNHSPVHPRISDFCCLLDPCPLALPCPLQMIKPVYGFLSDAVPLFGYRRCSYLALCGVLGGGGGGGGGGAPPARRCGIQRRRSMWQRKQQ